MKKGKDVTKEGLSSKQPVNYKPVEETTGQRIKPRTGDTVKSDRGKFKMV